MPCFKWYPLTNYRISLVYIFHLVRFSSRLKVRSIRTQPRGHTIVVHPQYCGLLYLYSRKSVYSLCHNSLVYHPPFGGFCTTSVLCNSTRDKVVEFVGTVFEAVKSVVKSLTESVAARDHHVNSDQGYAVGVWLSCVSRIVRRASPVWCRIVAMRMRLWLRSGGWRKSLSLIQRTALSMIPVSSWLIKLLFHYRFTGGSAGLVQKYVQALLEISLVNDYWRSCHRWRPVTVVRRPCFTSNTVSLG